MDNGRIITMEWVVEGITLVYVGFMVELITIAAGPDYSVSVLVYWSSAGLLAVMAVWHSLKGARMKILAMKLCPFIFSARGLLLK